MSPQTLHEIRRKLRILNHASEHRTDQEEFYQFTMAFSLLKQWIHNCRVCAHAILPPYNFTHPNCDTGPRVTFYGSNLPVLL